MNAAWSYFWPLFAAGLIIGAIIGLTAFRRRSKRNMKLAAGAFAALAFAASWHGPLGAGDRFTGQVERSVRATLVGWEIPQVSGQLQRDPLTRRVLLSGRADDFQRSELVRIIGAVPGVSDASWSGAKRGLPLVAEASMAAFVGFLTGLLVAYLVELRRRYNLQWKW